MARGGGDGVGTAVLEGREALREADGGEHADGRGGAAAAPGLEAALGQRRVRRLQGQPLLGAGREYFPDFLSFEFLLSDKRKVMWIQSVLVFFGREMKQ